MFLASFLSVHSELFNSQYQQLPAFIIYLKDYRAIVNGATTIDLVSLFYTPLFIVLIKRGSLCPSGFQGLDSTGHQSPPGELNASCSRGLWPLHTAGL